MNAGCRPPEPTIAGDDGQGMGQGTVMGGAVTGKTSAATGITPVEEIFGVALTACGLTTMPTGACWSVVIFDTAIM